MPGMRRQPVSHVQPGVRSIIYDRELRRPACVLLNAVGGGDPELIRLFDSDSWLVAPTPGMRRIMCTEEEARQLAALTDEARPKGGWR